MAELEYYLLIFCRIASLIYTAPFFSLSGVPKRTKIGFSMVISYLLYTVIPKTPVMEYDTVIGYAVLVMKEVIAGLLLGYACNICTTVVGFAGRIIDMEIGLSMASLMDPATKENLSITGALYQYAVTLMLIITGMYQYILKALVESFTLIPVTGALFVPEKLLSVMLKFLADYVLMGFRICLPVFAVMIILNAILGILTKVAPQMNMFSVGIQMKVFVGLIVLVLTTRMLPDISNMIFTEMKTMMVAFVEAMM